MNVLIYKLIDDISKLINIDDIEELYTQYDSINNSITDYKESDLLNGIELKLIYFIEASIYIECLKKFR